MILQVPRPGLPTGRGARTDVRQPDRDMTSTRPDKIGCGRQTPANLRGGAMTDDRPSLGTLVAGITAELSALVRGEIELAKAELRESAKAGAAGAILFVGRRRPAGHGVAAGHLGGRLRARRGRRPARLGVLPDRRRRLPARRVDPGAIGVLPAQEGPGTRAGQGRARSAPSRSSSRIPPNTPPVPETCACCIWRRTPSKA